MAVESIESGQAQSGWKRPRGTPSLAEVFGSIKTRPTGSFWRKLVAFLGPGYLVAVGYMDPGNWATSLAGGSKFGYALLFIALLSNIMAIILQALCARLGVASGRDLETAGRLGSLAAAEIISHIGARPEVSLQRLARENGLLP